MAEFGGMGFRAKDTIFTALAADVIEIPATPFAMGGNLTEVRGLRLSGTRRNDADAAAVPAGCRGLQREPRIAPITCNRTQAAKDNGP